MLSDENKTIFMDPVGAKNGVTVQSLGICSALAVTTQVKASLVMALAVTVVIVVSNVVISMLRNMIPGKIRIIIQLTVIASMVILVDQVLQAFMYDVSKQLSVFVGLIITNCIVMGRLEAFAMHEGPGKSLLDGLGAGLGYGWVIVAIGVARETLGSGSFLGIKFVPQALYDIGYVNNGLMLLAPGAFLAMGLIIWAQRTFDKSLVEEE